MSSRDLILNSIRAHKLVPQPLPETTGPWIVYDDPLAQFTKMLDFVGGQCQPVEDLAAADQHLRAQPQWRLAAKTISHVAGVGETNVDLSTITDPHQLEDIDFAVIEGEFAIAENAAVWVWGHKMVHRTLPFITQHLAIVFRRSELLHNMPQGYERLQFNEPGFGVFISGPSKTADIEQSLVIGAHGARSLTVYCVG
jgi:L-lactate dehydrogenase complex protein LldG